MKVMFTYQGVAYGYKGVIYTYNIADEEKRGFSVSLLEKAFKDIVERFADVDAVYMNRPKAVTPQTKRFAVVNVVGNIEDMAAYGSARVRVALYVKDVADFKNYVALDDIQNSIVSNFPYSWNVTDDDGTIKASYEFDDHPSVSGDIPDDFGFHSRYIMFNVLIKVL